MKIGIMQPYLFPYLGYFQLINAVDQFVIYDDVNYIRQGYINRNTILMGNSPQRFTVAVPGASSFKKINTLSFDVNVAKVLKTVHQAYHKRPYFEPVFSIVEKVLTAEQRQIPMLCQYAFKEIFAWLGIEVSLHMASDLNYSRDETASGKVMNICRTLGGDHYINSPGGQHLYHSDEFVAQGMKLSFIKMDDVHYPQGGGKFHAGLSIIDVLMNCSPSEVKVLLGQYQLI
ncbi:WbqC family protein [Citrobacter koseri]|nr:WbqC family protein [Citrobacter koseri]HEI8488369.1 WbqC family protein [Citrobacter koseri]HEJ0422382.1 WbqC family protein [Citrobacter koseri]HEM6872363.1 WbqC family protein [Citrobacter koseri]HEM8583359.1 WbqC family protein [Citrobacter koseri]